VTPDNREPESGAESPMPFEAEAYIRLLQFPGTVTRTAGGARTSGRLPVVDAIVVPTVRSAQRLRSALQLAMEARCQLVPLYTETFPDDLSAVLGRIRPDVKPLALPYGMRHDMLDLAARLPQPVMSSSACDISRKRNLGLLIGRMCGWTRMLFLDDDIRMLNAGKLNAAATLLDEYPIVGLQVNRYPDSSVVGHARRLIERKQRPFISGGSLLVNPQAVQGYFPPVYHEDWLWVMSHLRLGQVAIGGTVGQLNYKPFTPQRAALEEYGDILAAGLLWLVCANKQTTQINPAVGDISSVTGFRDFCNEAIRPQFWANILSQRSTVLDTIYRNLEQRYKKGSSPLKAIEAAQWRRAELQPADFVSFTEEWLNSLVEWQARLPALPRADSVMKALTELGLSHVVRAPAAGGLGSQAGGMGTTRRALTRGSSADAFRARRWPMVARAADWAATQRPFERAMHGGLLSVSRRASERFRGPGGS
jgi:hypothetical protein